MLLNSNVGYLKYKLRLIHENQFKIIRGSLRQFQTNVFAVYVSAFTSGKLANTGCSEKAAC